MKNFVQPGFSVEYTAPTDGVTSGTPVQIGQLVVVSAVTISADDAAGGDARFIGQTCGVFSVPKADSEEWDEGDVVYWSEADGVFTTEPSGNLQAGTAVEAVAGDAGLTTGVVRLDGIAREQEDT